MWNDWRKLKNGIATLGTLVLLGAAVLSVGLNKDLPVSEVSFLNFELLNEAPRPNRWAQAEEAIHDVQLSCDLRAVKIPESAGMVRFHIPRCPNLRLLRVRNETAGFDGTMYEQNSGASTSELIGLEPGSNTFSFFIEELTPRVAEARRPASVASARASEQNSDKTLMIYRQALPAAVSEDSLF